MPILNDFCDALKQAISKYEGEVQPVPLHRQQEIQTLRARIDQCLQDKIDSVEFREEMVEYTKNIPAGLFAFIPAFDSRLRKYLLAVLNQERFSEKKLASKERTEDRTFYRTEIDTLRIQITTLTDALAAERAKDNIQKINELMNTVRLQQQNIDLLATRNGELLQSLSKTVGDHQTLKTNYEILSKSYDDLKSKYENLLEERGKTPSDNQNAKPANNYPSSLFN